MSAINERSSWLRKQGVMLMLFVAFCLTSLLVLQQQRTIESQRTLIRDLFHDSMELTQLKVKASTKARH